MRRTHRLSGWAWLIIVVIGWAGIVCASALTHQVLRTHHPASISEAMR